jgi:hypothetical protein
MGQLPYSYAISSSNNDFKTTAPAPAASSSFTFFTELVNTELPTMIGFQHKQEICHHQVPHKWDEANEGPKLELFFRQRILLDVIFPVRNIEMQALRQHADIRIKFHTI